jgi:hypothetical protein
VISHLDITQPCCVPPFGHPHTSCLLASTLSPSREPDRATSKQKVLPGAVARCSGCIWSADQSQPIHQIWCAIETSILGAQWLGRMTGVHADLCLTPCSMHDMAMLLADAGRRRNSPRVPVLVPNITLGRLARLAIFLWSTSFTAGPKALACDSHHAQKGTYGISISTTARICGRPSKTAS